MLRKISKLHHAIEDTILKVEGTHKHLKELSVESASEMLIEIKKVIVFLEKQYDRLEKNDFFDNDELKSKYKYLLKSIYRVHNILSQKSYPYHLTYINRYIMLTEIEFISLAKQQYIKLQELENIESYYDYEKSFDEIWTEYGRNTLEKSISETPKDRRKKNLCRYGLIEIANTHKFSNLVNGFKISPYMQEKMVFVGQNDCYEQGNEILSNLLGVSVNTMQLYRVTDTYGKMLEQDKLFEVDTFNPIFLR